MNDFIITPFESVRTNSEIFRLDATFDSIANTMTALINGKSTPIRIASSI